MRSKQFIAIFYKWGTVIFSIDILIVLSPKIVLTYWNNWSLIDMNRGWTCRCSNSYKLASYLLFLKIPFKSRNSAMENSLWHNNWCFFVLPCRLEWFIKVRIMSRWSTPSITFSMKDRLFGPRSMGFYTKSLPALVMNMTSGSQ